MLQTSPFRVTILANQAERTPSRFKTDAGVGAAPHADRYPSSTSGAYSAMPLRKPGLSWSP